ncbi:GntR family transcriptional regulator [Prolixibacteraceae bacterium JC049]|nr:GntR family transcriptional regulator [Prolixibacteraceae bacterium JC049]
MLDGIIYIDENSGVPKYRQIINSILEAIENKELKKGDKIPSINQICNEFELSRDTVMVAFNELKAKGILVSIPGKGYYIESVKTDIQQKVFVLFDELNVFKEDLYNSFLQHLDPRTNVDIYFHHFNFKVFKSLIQDSVGKYTQYVIMPATFDDTASIISQVPEDKVFILDRYKNDLRQYPMLYQDFARDVYEALLEGVDLLRKYEKLVMVFPGGKEPAERVKGFQKFCTEKGFQYEIIKTIADRELMPGEVYFVPTDRNLVKLLKGAEAKDLQLGENFGVVSFNDTVLKEVVSGGITTISTDFIEMGKQLASLINSKKPGKITNPCRLIRRKSL